MAKDFAPLTDVLQPNASSKNSHIGTVRIDVSEPDHPLQRVHVLFYADGSIRMRVSNPQMVLTECFLGGEGKHVIVKLEPKDAGIYATKKSA